MSQLLAENINTCLMNLKVTAIVRMQVIKHIRIPCNWQVTCKSNFLKIVQRRLQAISPLG